MTTNGHGTRPLLGAVLIVKNEAQSIERTLDSLLPFVDALSIFDTGSTDGTPEILRARMASLDLALVKPLLHTDVPFGSYAAARNHALDTAAALNPTVFTLSLSADETVAGGAALREYLEKERDSADGAFCIMMQADDRQWPFPRVLRTGGGWRYANAAGQRHEQPLPPDDSPVAARLIPQVTVRFAESDPARKLQRLRQEDLPELTAVVEDDSKSLSERLEPMFQLAETHFALGHNDRMPDGSRDLGGRWLSHLFQSMALYTRFAEIAEAFAHKMKEIGEPEWPFLLQRAMYAQFSYLNVAESFGLFEPAELVKRLTAVAAVAPRLPEVHWALARNAARIDPRKALPLLLRAAKVARKVYDEPVHGATDVTLEWRSYLLAARCAKAIKDTKLQHSFAKQALAAGAPRTSVEEFAAPGTLS